MATIVIADTAVRDFTRIPNAAIWRADMTPRAFRVLCYLLSETNGSDTSTARIAAVLGMSDGTAKNAIRDLEKLGYVSRQQEQGENGQFNQISYIVTPNPQAAGEVNQ